MIVGSTIGRYEVIREIGRSNDIIYEAWDPSFDRRVAIKLLNIPDGIDPQVKSERIIRFKREAQALGALLHQNIMQVYDCGDFGDSHYIVMELVEGQSLRTYLDTHCVIDIPNVQLLLSQVITALQYCHGKGIVHRDLKPANIQLTHDGTLKLLDFGIARMDWQPNVTQTGQVFGTLNYMSPEQCHGRHVDARSDLFSIGIIAFEMLTGCLPFGGSSTISIAHAIVAQEPTYPSGIDPHMKMFLQKALSKDVAQRYQTAEEMLYAVQKLGSKPVANPTPIPQVVNPTPRPRNPQIKVPAQDVNPYYAAFRSSLLVSLPIVCLGFFIPSWRLWLFLICVALAIIAWWRDNEYKIMMIPFALTGIAIFRLGLPPIDLFKVEQKPQPKGAYAFPRGQTTGTKKQNQPSKKSRTSRTGKVNNLSKVDQRRLSAQSNSHLKSKTKAAQRPAKNKVEDSSRPSLRGNSRVGDSNESDQDGENSNSGLRSGSKLGGSSE